MPIVATKGYLNDKFLNSHACVHTPHEKLISIWQTKILLKPESHNSSTDSSTKFSNHRISTNSLNVLTVLAAILLQMDYFEININA